MSTKFKTHALQVLLVLLLSGLVFWGFEESNDQYKIQIFGLAALILTVITSVYTVVLNNNAARNREYEFVLLKEKAKYNADFYQAFFLLAENQIEKDESKQAERLENAKTYLKQFKMGLMNWGSEDLIKALLKFEDELANDTNNQLRLLNAGDTFIRKLREEIGFKDSGDFNMLELILTPQGRKLFFKK